LDFAIQIASCLEYLHENKLMHRDLKPENVFVVKTDGRYLLKVGDFGVAKKFVTDNLNTTIVGTPAYMAPEIVIKKEHNEKVDLFSMGALLYKLMTNKERQLWSEITENAEKTMQSIEQDIKQNYPNELYNLTINLLSPDPHKRLSAKQVKEVLLKISSKESISGSTVFFVLMFPVDDLSRLYGPKFVTLLERIYTNDPTLTEVIVTSYGGENELGTEGAEFLSKALEKNTVIRSINLERTKIGSVGLEFLGDYIAKNKTITTVKLANNGIGNDGVKIVSKAFKNNFSISSLDLSHNNIGEDGAVYLGEALYDNHLTAKTRVDWKYVVERKKFGINFLNLEGNNIGKGGGQHIFNKLHLIQTLEEFNFSANKLGEDGMEKLGKYLKRNTSIHTFILNENDIGPKGLKFLCDAISIQSRVKKGETPEPDEELDKEARKVRHDSDGDLDDDYDDDDEKEFPPEKLILRKNKIGMGAKMENAKYEEGMKSLRDMLKINENMVHLDLQSNFISAKDLKILAEGVKKSRLQLLDLGKNDIRDDGVKILADTIKTTTTLKVLSLKDNKIGSKGIQMLAAAISASGTLSDLDLAYNKFGNEGTKYIAQTLKPSTVSKGLFGLQSTTIDSNVQMLYLQGNEIGDGGVAFLCDAMKSNKSLKHLFLQGNRIGERGIMELAHILSLKTCVLQTLDISGGEHEEISNDFRDDGAKLLAEALSDNTSLLQLFLDRNKISNEGAHAFSKILPKSNLVNFSLAYNEIGNDGVKQLSDSIEGNKKLVKLYLRENPIKSDLKALYRQKDPRFIFGDKEEVRL
jgi:Ran GTPase-activating protein (RanGAP) involved in mRNA processing and transport